MPESETILLLGGTTEAYSLAEKLYRQNVPLLSSLAGRTSHPKIPAGRYRIGGFGGVKGLVETIRNEKIGLIIDATHPFAETMTDHAWQAAKEANIFYVRFERPLWQAKAQDKWQIVGSLKEAVNAIAKDSCCFLAIGRQHLAEFLVRDDVKFVARMVERPKNVEDVKNLEIILAKPQTEEQERAFLTKYHFDCLVCRNSGGNASYHKLAAARQIGLPVIMITRKALPDVLSFTTEDEIINFVADFFQEGLQEKRKGMNGRLDMNPLHVQRK